MSWLVHHSGVLIFLAASVCIENVDNPTAFAWFASSAPDVSA